MDIRFSFTRTLTLTLSIYHSLSTKRARVHALPNSLSLDLSLTHTQNLSCSVVRPGTLSLSPPPLSFSSLSRALSLLQLVLVDEKCGVRMHTVKYQRVHDEESQ